jgi:ankyrin repeat protein
MWAAAEGHVRAVRALIALGADVRARSKNGFTALLFAARRGSAEAAETLIAAGADVNDVARDGATPLIVATVAGHASLAVSLLQRGADPNADSAGYTALHWVAHRMESEFAGPFGLVDETSEWSAVAGLQEESRRALLAALLAHGADPNVQMKRQLPYFGFRQAPLEGAVSRGLNMLGATPFLLAAKAGDAASMRLLLKHGADSQLRMTENTPPLMLAAGWGRTIGQSSVTESDALEAARVVLETGADVNAANARGETALHGAAYQGWNAMVQLLVSHGANLNAKNARGETPLYIAEGHVYHSGGYNPHPDTAELLRKLGAEEHSIKAPGPARR